MSSTELTASVPASAFPTPGLYYVSVYEPGPGGGVSDPQPLAVGTFVSPGGIVSAADPTNAQLSPGAIMSIYGAGLSHTTMLAALPLPTNLGGTEVLVNNIPAPLIFVSPSQINFVVPWEASTTSQSQGTVVVQNMEVQTAPSQVPLLSSAPSVFTLNEQGIGQGAVLIAGTDVIAAPVGAFPGSRPAMRGEYVEIYATGLGPVDQPLPDGQPSSGPDSTILVPTVFWNCERTGPGNVSSTPTYVGLAPGFPGLYQINVQVPETTDVPSGNAVPITFYTFPSTNVFTIAIQ